MTTNDPDPRLHGMAEQLYLEIGDGTVEELEAALRGLVNRGLLTVGPARNADGLEELTEFIIEHVPGEPSRAEGQMRTALRILQRHYGPSSPTTEAEALWGELNLQDNDQVTDAVLVAKITDFQRGGVAVSMSATDGLDWVTQFGMLHAAIAIMHQNEYRPREGG